ncbi:MAG: hypothetical protein A2X94_16000 [Bdellovibrionales bacterium GWB1_55_8]|nr:MAG: hypothetical protein A2X94_16000 [Bdellovibrionales bacterium GWB1_55_8]
MKAAELIGKTAVGWDSCAACSDNSVLRLSLLRDLIGRLHALRSEGLATQNQNLISSIEEVETRIVKMEAARSFPATGKELENWLTCGLPAEVTPVAPVPNRELPPTLVEKLGGIKKLNRPDRLWERKLVEEAFRLSWVFWSVVAELPLEIVETWHEDLKKRLWPEGLVLFVEADSNPASDRRNWRGRWIVIRRATAQNHISEAPEWKLLFPPSGT